MWEYLTLDQDRIGNWWAPALGTISNDRLTAMNLLGDDGWELVGIEGGDEVQATFYFKRPKR